MLIPLTDLDGDVLYLEASMIWGVFPDKCGAAVYMTSSDQCFLVKETPPDVYVAIDQSAWEWDYEGDE